MTEREKKKKKDDYLKAYMPNFGGEVKKRRRNPHKHTKKFIRLFSHCDLIKWGTHLGLPANSTEIFVNIFKVMLTPYP